MSKNKTHSEVELWRGRVKKLESEVRRLRKQNRQLEKELYRRGKTFKDEIVSKEVICPDCGKGRITSTDFKFVIIETCNICDYSKRTKPKRK